MDCVYRKRKSYMHRVLKEIESIIHKNIAEVLPNLSFDELEDDGTVFLMNGKNGTEFEWYVNEKLPVFMAFYNDEANMGAAKALMGKPAVVSKRITEDGYRVGYMKREEPRDEEDSGWSFWAGNEDEEYSNAIENLGLYPVWHIVDVDPTLMRYVDKPAGTALIRKSDDEFIDDNGEDPVIGKWKE